VVTTDQKQLSSLGSPLDLVIDTISAPHDANTYLNLLRRDGVLVLVGVPDRPLEIRPFPLVVRRRTLAGSNIGGIRETQEMLDYCAQKKIAADVEIIPIQKVNEAYERTIRGDVRYRFVIDMKTL
jgi:alcohol dehydrogenase (NADP+)